MGKRARSNSIIVNTNKIAGKVVNLSGMTDGQSLVYDETTDTFVPATMLTEDYDIGDVNLIFENALV